MSKYYKACFLYSGMHAHSLQLKNNMIPIVDFTFFTCKTKEVIDNATVGHGGNLKEL